MHAYRRPCQMHRDRRHRVWAATRQRMPGGRSASGTTAVSPAAVFADGTPLNLYGTVPTPGWTTYAAPGSPDSQAITIASATSPADSTGKFAAGKCSRVRAMIAVWAKPGHIALIVVPSAASRGAIDRTKAIAPPLATLYPGSPAIGESPARDAVTTIAPPPARLIAGRAASAP